MKVRIKKLGKLNKVAYGGQQPDGALDVVPSAWGGGNLKGAREGIQVKKTLTSEPREKANLEAEGGETAFGPISGDNIPDHMVIKGPRHTNGGVPLNLPDDTFIFSDTKKMRINDPKILKMFGKKPKKGGYTPAELAKPYDIQKYKAILMDPESDQKQRDTAEMMIKNYIMKLGALALAQEAKKGFPQGIPEMARPYMEANGITEEQLIPQEAQEEQQMMAQQQGPPPQQMPSGAPVAMPQPMPGQPPMTFGGPAGLDKFVYADNGLVVEGDQTGLINDLPSSPWADAFQNVNAPDNPYKREDEIPQIEVDNPDPITNQQVEEGTVESTEKLINPKGKATFKLRNAFDVNTGELARRTFNYAMPLATNIIKGFDNSRIAGRDQRALLGNRDQAKNEVDTGRSSALSGRDFPYKQGTEMIVQYGGIPIAQDGVGGVQNGEITPTQQPFVNVYEGPLTEADIISLNQKYATTVGATKPNYRTILSDEEAQADEAYKRRLFENYARSGSSDVNWNASRDYPSVGYRGYSDQMLNEAKKYAYIDLQSEEGKRMTARDTRDIIEDQRHQKTLQDQMFGGTPMAAYGMTMGGFDMPFVEEKRKVRIKKLPKADNGVTVEGIGANKISEEDLNKAIEEGTYTEAESSIGTRGGYRENYDVSARGKIGNKKFEGTNEEYLAGICQSMKTGSYKNRSLQWMIDNRIIKPEFADDLADCVTVEKEAVYIQDEPPTPEKKCECKDENGKLIEPQPQPVKDPKTGELKCPCPTTTKTSTTPVVQAPGYVDDPHWSDVATRGVYTAATMDPNVARAQVAMPDRVEVRPAYEDYLAKVQAIQSGLGTASRQAALTADPSKKMAMLSQLVGKAAPAAALAVAETQARNVGRQQQANAAQAQADARFAAQQADALTKQAFINASVRDKETLNWNALRAQTQGKIQEAQTEMQGRQMTNALYPQYATDYAQGLLYHTGIPKPLVPEKPALTASEMLTSPELAGLTDAAKEAIIVDRMKKNAMAKGGYVMGANVFPFMFY